MHFVLQTPSLQHLASVKIVTCLWNQRLPNLKRNVYEHKWKDIEEIVRNKVSALSLPDLCKKELFNVIKPIGMEIITWCRYHNLYDDSYKSVDNLLPQQFGWSMHGIIDYAKTAELIVKDDRLSIEKRFEFACLNCLEDEAEELIELIPNHRIHKYISEAVRYESMDHRILVAYFACTLSGDEDLLDRLYQAKDLRGAGSVNEHLFQVVLYKGPRATCEYFSQKVSRAETGQVYVRRPFRGLTYPTCGLMYRLSFLNAEQPELAFPGCTAYLFMLLLRWPLQPLFRETAKRAWQLMDSEECAEVLGGIICNIRYGYQNYGYVKWFREFWRSSSAEDKHTFLDDVDQLEDLIATKRKEFIQLVFNKAPAHLLKELIEERYEIISSVLMDERVIFGAALMECQEKAALKSLKNRDNMEKRLRSEHLSRLVDMVMESRIKSKEKHVKFDI